MNYHVGQLNVQPQSLPSALRDYLQGVSVARMSLNNKMLPFVRTITGNLLDIGGFCDLQPYMPAGKHIILDLIDSPRNTITADATMLPFPDNSLAGVMCLSVLEHCLRPEDILREIHRCLQPGGSAFISVPWLFESHMEPQDYWRFSDHLLKEIYRRNNFLIEELSPSNGYAGLLTHLLQQQVLTRYSFGLFMLLIEKLRPVTARCRWATIINCIVKKAGTSSNEPKQLDAWVNLLRCPRCAQAGEGLLRWGVDEVSCLSCGSRFAIRDKTRVCFAEQASGV